MTHETAYIGKPLSRVDGRAKVTGAAKYAAEFNVPRLLHGYVLSGRIARGRIASIDDAAALALPGVARVFTHENRPGESEGEDRRTEPAPAKRRVRPPIRTFPSR